ncbi:MAG: NAD(P)/FAD-dependent oxidoreductase [Deltaproteobacteria bacterium]|nr:MAG: NAD(P)/FAD-dependent oxidoreductase [Deltaproteobacteria bacterium]
MPRPEPLTIPPRGNAPFHVAIIGAGFGGIGAAIQLRRAGFHDFTILEAASDIGGTWRDNTYPGAACDVQSHLYSFSFAPWPHWDHMFARQEQILAYLRWCAGTHGLDPHLRLDCPVREARFDEKAQHWRLRVGNGDELVAHAVISATGGLSQPQWPDIPGQKEFRGEQFHTARWNHDVELDGQRVAVIGTGASAIQVVPAIADRVRSLDLFQRTPPWVLPKPDRTIGPRERTLLENLPALQWLQRQRIYWSLEPRVLGFVIHPRIMGGLQALAKLHLRRSIQDSELRTRVTPDYTIGCKRILMSNDYYDALQRPHVTVHAGGASGLTPGGVLDGNGHEQPADVVIHATGFKAADAPIPYTLTGLDGASLNDRWAREGAAAFKGTTVHGFPNFFLIVGPNTGLGHSSMVHIIESQITYVLDALRTIARTGANWIDVRQEAQDQWNADLQKRLAGTVWASGCNAWYQSSHGRNTTLWPGFTWQFRQRTRRFDANAYLTDRDVA